MYFYLFLYITLVHTSSQDAPRFTSILGPHRTGDRGGTIVLRCEADGTPAPTLQWFKDDLLLTNSERISVSGSTVTINDLQNDGVGIYKCVYTNSFGHISTTTIVAINGGAVITIPPRNQTVNVGGSVRFECKTGAVFNNITYTWYKDNFVISALDHLRSRVEIASDGALTFDGATLSDSGWYKCEVFNGVGAPMSARGYLTVKSTPTADIPETHYNLARGRSAEIECIVTGSPPANKVEWTKSDLRINFNATNRYTVSTNWSLLITNVTLDDDGYYQCVPFNEEGRGFGSKNAFIATHDPPIFTLLPDVSYAVKVNGVVSIPCGARAPITDLNQPKIRWRKVSGSMPEPRRVFIHPEGNLTVYNVSKTDRGKYQCVASGSTVESIADTSIRVESTTPHAPSNVSVSFGHYDAKVTWIPGFDGGFDQTFTIKFRETGTKITPWQNLSPPNNKPGYKILDLIPETEYEIKVYSSNTIGDGPESQSVIGNTQGYRPDGVGVLPTDSSGKSYFPKIIKRRGPTPAPPQNLTSTYTVANSLKLSWFPPDNSPVPILYYKIQYRKEGDFDWMDDEPILANRTMDIFQPDVKDDGKKKYYFRVVSYGLLSYSDYSSPITVTVPQPESEVMSQGAIIGITFAGVAFLAMIITILVVVCDCCKSRNKKKHEQHNGVQYSQTPQFSTSTRNDRKSFYPYHGGRFTVDSDTDPHIYVTSASKRTPPPNLSYNSLRVNPHTISSQKSSSHSHNPYADPSLMHGFYDVRTGTQITPYQNPPSKVIHHDSSDGGTLGANSHHSRYVGQFDPDPHIHDWFTPHESPESYNFNEFTLNKDEEIVLKPSLPRHSSMKPNYVNQGPQGQLFEPSMSTVRNQSIPQEYWFDQELHSPGVLSPNSIDNQFNTSYRYVDPAQQRHEIPDPHPSIYRQSVHPEFDRASISSSGAEMRRHHYNRDHLIGTIERVRTASRGQTRGHPDRVNYDPHGDDFHSYRNHSYSHNPERPYSQNPEHERYSHNPEVDYYSQNHEQHHHNYMNNNNNRGQSTLSVNTGTSYHYDTDYYNLPPFQNMTPHTLPYDQPKPRLSSGGSRTNSSSAMTSGLGRTWSRGESSVNSRLPNSTTSLRPYQSSIMEDAEPSWYEQARQSAQNLYPKPINTAITPATKYRPPPSDSVDENYEFDPVLVDSEPIDFFHIYQLNRDDDEFYLRPPLYGEQSRTESERQRLDRLRQEYLDFRQRQQDSIKNVYRLESAIL